MLLQTRWSILGYIYPSKHEQRNTELMWNALGTRISVSGAPSSFFAVPDPMAAESFSCLCHELSLGNVTLLLALTLQLHPSTLSLVLPELKYSWLPPFLSSRVCSLPSCSRSSSGWCQEGEPHSCGAAAVPEIQGCRQWTRYFRWFNYMTMVGKTKQSHHPEDKVTLGTPHCRGGEHRTCCKGTERRSGQRAQEHKRVFSWEKEKPRYSICSASIYI